MDVSLAFYHGIREQVRRVVLALGPERTDLGLSAFEDGHSSWSDCFFARALPDVNLNREGEDGVARALKLFGKTPSGLNLIPVRIVYHTFDNLSTVITKDQMKKLISDIRDESRDPELMALIRSIDYTGVEERPIHFELACAND
jgi:hypothetical protein